MSYIDYFKIEHYRLGEELRYVGICGNYTKTKSYLKKCYNDPTHNLYNCSLFRAIRDNGEMKDFNWVKLGTKSIKNKMEKYEEYDKLLEKYKPTLSLRDRPIDPDDIYTCRHGLNHVGINTCKVCKKSCKHDYNKYLCPLCKPKEDPESD